VNALLAEAELAALARHLGERLPAGAVVWLEGELGAGKTTFARALVAGLGVREEATSPTYGLVHRHRGARGDVYHVDCYRLRHPEEAADLDWAALAAGDALLIEWPSRAGAWAPPATHRVRLGHTDRADRRSVEVT